MILILIIYFNKSLLLSFLFHPNSFLLAIPSGYLGDIYRRDSLLKLSGVIGFIAVFVGLFCFTFVQPLPGFFLLFVLLFI